MQNGYAISVQTSHMIIRAYLHIFRQTTENSFLFLSGNIGKFYLVFTLPHLKKKQLKKRMCHSQSHRLLWFMHFTISYKVNVKNPA